MYIVWSRTSASLMDWLLLDAIALALKVHKSYLLSGLKYLYVRKCIYIIIYICIFTNRALFIDGI